MPRKENSCRSDWAAYTAQYRKKNPEKVEIWEANTRCRQLRRYIEKHPEEADRIRKEVFGE